MTGPFGVTDPWTSRVSLARLAAFLVLGLSVARFAFEIGQIRQRCCDDFPIFWDTVLAYERGEPLYRADRLETYLPGTPTYKFTPFYASLLRAARKLGVERQVLPIHFWLDVLLYLSTVMLLCWSLTGQPLNGRALPVWLVALNMGPFFETLSGLQVEIPILACLVVAAAALQRRQDFAAGAAIGLAASLKLYPALLLAPLAFARRPRAVAAFLVTSLACAAVGLACFGAGETHDYFLKIVPYMSAERPAEDYGTENLAVASYLASLRGGHWALAALEPAVAARVGTVVAVLLLAVSLLASRGWGASGRVWPGLGLAVPILLLWLPNSWSNYQLLLLLPAAVALAGRGVPSKARFAALCACGLLSYHQNVPTDWPAVVPFHPGLWNAWQTARVAATLLCWLAMLWTIRTPEVDGLASHAPVVQPN